MLIMRTHGAQFWKISNQGTPNFISYSRFDAFLVQEMRVNRRKSIDTRCHACLYFITPTGHSLKPLDSCTYLILVEFMKRLGHRVNLIPVIAKSDTMTDSENKAFKARILEDIAVNQISIYIPKK
jgi:septin 7